VLRGARREREALPEGPLTAAGFAIVVAGASWGGLRAFRTLLRALPADLPVPVVLAQHRGADGVSGGLVDVLGRSCALEVVDAEDKDALSPGRVYVAPPDYHLLVEPGSLALSVDERVRFSRPSIDVLFESAARAYAERTIAIVLTGANDDGAAGLALVAERGGLTIVEDPATAERREMPAAALAVVAADHVLPLDEIGPLVAGLCGAAAVS